VASILPRTLRRDANGVVPAGVTPIVLPLGKEYARMLEMHNNNDNKEAGTVKDVIIERGRESSERRAIASLEQSSSGNNSNTDKIDLGMNTYIHVHRH
jgi:hypothetical protein